MAAPGRGRPLVALTARMRIRVTDRGPPGPSVVLSATPAERHHSRSKGTTRLDADMHRPIRTLPKQPITFGVQKSTVDRRFQHTRPPAGAQTGDRSHRAA